MTQAPGSGQNAGPPSGVRPGLREAALGGARLSAFAQLSIEVIAFAASIVLARLIAPEQFGLVAVALIVPSVAVALSFQGIAAPLVQRPEIRPAHVEGAMLLSLALGVSLSVATVLLAPPVLGGAFGDETVRFLQIASPVFALAGLRAVPFALLQRKLDFRRLTRIEVASRLAGAAAAVGLALAGVDGESIVIGALVTAAVSALLLLSATPFRLPRWRGNEIRELCRFGTPAALASLTYHAGRNADYAILAVKLSAAQVGFYWRAYQLGVEYQTKLTSVMLRVAFPLFSRTRNDGEIRTLRLRITRVHSSTILPLLAAFIVAAPTLVPWLYGPAWEPAVLPAQLLAVAGMAVALSSGIGSIILAVGNPRSLLAWNAITLVMLVAAVTGAAEYGLIAACLGVVGANLVAVAGAYYFLLYRQVGIPLASLAAEAAPGLVAAGTVVAVGIPLQGALEGAGLPDVAVLLAVGLASAVLHGTTLHRLFPAAWHDLLVLGRRLITRSGKSAPAASPASPAEAPVPSL